MLAILLPVKMNEIEATRPNSCSQAFARWNQKVKTSRMLFKYVSSGWILLVPKHSLLKYFTLTFTRHKSSKFEVSGPPTVDLRTPRKTNSRDLRFETWGSIFWPLFWTGTKKCQVHFSYLLHHGNLCKGPWTLRKFPQKCQKIAGC